MIVIIGMILTGLFRIFVLGDDLQAPSAGLHDRRRARTSTGFALVLPAAAGVLLRLAPR